MNLYDKSRKPSPQADEAAVLVNGQHVYCGTWSQCHAYVMLLNFGPGDLVQLQGLVWTPGPFD